MSGAEDVVGYDPGYPVYLDLVQTDFGEFRPGSQAYRDLLGHLGESGLFGGLLAERLDEAGRLQGEHAELLAVTEAQVSGTDPHAYTPGAEVGLTDERILRIAQLEVSERMQREDGESPQADGLLVNYFNRQVNAGADPLRYWMQVNRARRHVRSLLN